MAKDPVSGNEIPPGGVAKDVRDDVPIMASENEYIIPANVVRFLGLDKLEKLVSKAKEELSKMEDAGRMGGEAPEEGELPFDPAELAMVDDEDLQALPDQTPQQFAEGGLVGGGNVDPEFTGIKEFKNSNGDIMYIPYMYGEPQQEVPSGYTEKSPTEVSAKAPNPMDRVASPADSNSPNAKGDPSTNERTNGKSPLAGSPNDWSYQAFINFEKSKGSVGEKAIKGIISAMPMGGIAMKAREKYLDKQTAHLMDQMLETGVDPQGTPLSAEQKVQLSTTRESLKSQMSEQSGLNLNPIERLSNVFDQFSNFLGGDKAAASPQVTVSSRNQPTGAPRSATPGFTAEQNASRSTKDSQYSGGGYGMGSDLGRDPSKGPSEGSMASGGLYKQGGLVQRRKK